MSVETRRTTCNRDCPDACGILATVDDGRVVALRGDPAHPVTRGFLCFRTSRYLEQHDGPQRVRQPLLRQRGELRPVGWEEALGFVAERLRRVRDESGPASILHYRSGGSLGILKHLTDHFFDLFGPCSTKVGDICSGAGEAAQVADFGVSDSNDLFDLLHSRNVLLWGKNPTVSNVHLLPVLDEARERGARLWLIDPVRHQTGSRVDVVLTPAPGRDPELALGVARALFDLGTIDPAAPARCDGLDAFAALARRRTVAEWSTAAGVDAAATGALAAALRDGPTAILVGWGMQRRRRGGATVRALDALSAITGNLFVPGGGCSFYFRRRAAFGGFGPAVPPPRTFREPLLAQDLAAADPPVRLLWVTAGNPVAMLPDSAAVARELDRLECLVVADCLLTDTARRAHVVLPVPSLLEDDDVLGAYGHHWLGESRPVVPIPDGVRHEVHVFQDLARRLGVAAYPQDPLDELKRQALAPAAAHGVGLDELRAAGGAIRSPFARPQLFADGRVATPNGKVQLLADLPDPEPLPAPPERRGGSEPLWLFSNSTNRSQASVWAGKGLEDGLWVAAHPDAVPGLPDGAPVVVESALGALDAVLRHDATQRRDVAIVPKGGWFDRGQSANALIAAAATDLGLGAAYLDCLVRIRPR